MTLFAWRIKQDISNLFIELFTKLFINLFVVPLSYMCCAIIANSFFEPPCNV